MTRPHWPKGRNKNAAKRERADTYDAPLQTSLSFEEIIGKLANTPAPKPDETKKKKRPVKK